MRRKLAGLVDARCKPGKITVARVLLICRVVDARRRRP
jgi:hypothetical protein